MIHQVFNILDIMLKHSRLMKQGARNLISSIVETVWMWIQWYRSGSLSETKEAANMLLALIEGWVCQMLASSLELGGVIVCVGINT